MVGSDVAGQDGAPQVPPGRAGRRARRRRWWVAALAVVLVLGGVTVGLARQHRSGGLPGGTVQSGFFSHPGILVSGEQLAFVRSEIQAGAQPWTALLRQAEASSLATASPQPTGLVLAANPRKACDPSDPQDCVAYCNSDGEGNTPACTAEVNAAAAAYTQSLLGYYTGRAGYSESAAALLRTWSHVLSGHRGSDAPLRASWAAENFTRAAEILRATYVPADGRPAVDVAALGQWFRLAFLPVIRSYAVLPGATGGAAGFGNVNGNWGLSGADAMIDIAVFTDDRSLFDDAVAYWRLMVPSYIYLSGDGTPAAPPASTAYAAGGRLLCHWFNDRPPSCDQGQAPEGATVQNGQVQEVCRDFGHTLMGLGSMLDLAETAYHQGLDLFSGQRARIMAAVEYVAEVGAYYAAHDGHYPPGLCAGYPPTAAPPTGSGPFTIAYNAYAQRLGQRFGWLPIPGVPTGDPNLVSNSIQAALRQVVAAPTADVPTGRLMNIWATLTHYGVG